MLGLIMNQLLIRTVLMAAYAMEDDYLCDEDELLHMMFCVDAVLRLALMRLSLRRIAFRSLLYDDGDKPSLATLDPRICRELFRFDAPDLLIMAEALGWAGETFRIHTGHAESKNWYVANGETVLLMLLYRFASPGRLLSMTIFFKCGPSKLSAFRIWLHNDGLDNSIHWYGSSRRGTAGHGRARSARQCAGKSNISHEIEILARYIYGKSWIWENDNFSILLHNSTSEN
jgi:hypothetical protein